MSCVGNFVYRYTFWDKKGVTGPHWAGTAEPAGSVGPAGAAGPASAADPVGAVGPAPHHDSGPGDYRSHEHALDG
jgi:hypothetical protein